MKFYIYDVQKGKGYWRTELPTHAADCWIAIPQFIPWHLNGVGGKPNLRVVEDLKRAMSDD